MLCHSGLSGWIDTSVTAFAVVPLVTGDPRCAVLKQPFQGWRYLKPEDAPDAAVAKRGTLSPPSLSAQPAEIRIL
jgi:hypothetical protein